MRGVNDYPRGNPENPVSTETLEDKFVGLVAPRYGEAFALRAVERGAFARRVCRRGGNVRMRCG